MTARNYWPHELTGAVGNAGFELVDLGFVWPVLDVYPWLPVRLRERYQRHITRFDSTRGLRRFGVSTLVVARN